MAEPTVGRTSLGGIILGTLAGAGIVLGAATAYVFSEAEAFPCCFIPAVLTYLLWFVNFVTRRGSRGIVHYLVPLLLAVGLFVACGFVDGIQQVKEGMPRAYIMNQLKQIALALHDYHDKHGAFPPAVVRGLDGTPLYSWRVAILPFMDEEALYARFRRDEPWDSPHNRALLSQAPPAYAPARYTAASDPSATFFRVFVGPGTAFDGDTGLNLKADFPDGSAKTILVVEAREAVPWTKPVDVPYGAGQSLPALGIPRRYRIGRLQFGEKAPLVFCAAMADGSVRTFDLEMPSAALRGWITRNGGEKPAE
jgi:hypothetical protein